MYVSHDTCKVENPAHLSPVSEVASQAPVTRVWEACGFSLAGPNMPEELIVDRRILGWFIWMERRVALRAGWRSSSVRSIITCGGGARGARRSGRHVARRQGRDGEGVFQIRSYCPGYWDKLQAIKFDERGTSREGEDGGWKDALEGK